MQIIKKSLVTEKMLGKIQYELATLAHLDHPAIMKLHEAFDEKHKIFVVTEVMKGSNLVDKIQKNK